MTGKITRTLKGNQQAIRCVTFSRNGRRVTSGRDDKSMKVWDTGSGRELFTLTGHGETVSSVAYSPDGLLLIGGSDDALVKLWCQRALKTGHPGDQEGPPMLVSALPAFSRESWHWAGGAMPSGRDDRERRCSSGTSPERLAVFQFVPW